MSIFNKKKKEPIRMDAEARRKLEEGIEQRRQAHVERKRLATEVLDFVRDEIIVFMPYFNRAVLKMPLQYFDTKYHDYDLPDGMGTNGAVVLANPNYIVDTYKAEHAKLPRVYLHMLFHCIFSHPFQYERLNIAFWDFAADTAVENAILDLQWTAMELPDDSRKRQLLIQLRERIGDLTAENIYHYLYGHEDEAEEILANADLFRMDFHELWKNQKDRNDEVPDYHRQGHDDGASADWDRLGRNIRIDLDHFEKNQGDIPGSLTENLREVMRDRYNYTEFLKKFIINREELQINPDEFDYVYYSYGMKLYRNMPLIEPLEYKDANKIHDFVIAIDTSGSCQGRTVRNFISRTYAIMKSADSFFRTTNIHIIQCDATIQEDVKITSQDDFERYMQQMEIKGGGGTDFRPVFDHVQELQKSGELKKLRGLLYFTDGLGTFPAHMPNYKTAFIFIRDRRNDVPKIPPWAMKLVLRDEDLEMPKRKVM